MKELANKIKITSKGAEHYHKEQRKIMEAGEIFMQWNVIQGRPH